MAGKRLTMALIAGAALAGCSVNPDRVTGGPDQTSPLVEFNPGLFGIGRGAGAGNASAPAPEVPAMPSSAEDRLVTAIEAQGCVLTAANVDSVLVSAGLTTEELRVVTEQLVSSGRAELSGEGAIRVISSSCI
ncbi:hypothetical protein [Pseudoroseicyclus sp. CXY001]|uniref:hypothetical protein n=1 Tax=Pseudoroseicyclus sp. CXY001 TaxID=3242492 RepID=UPI0035711310